jgi:hypothetical protein
VTPINKITFCSNRRNAIEAVTDSGNSSRPKRTIRLSEKARESIDMAQSGKKKTPGKSVQVGFSDFTSVTSKEIS